jgi:hypothetical protein
MKKEDTILSWSLAHSGVAFQCQDVSGPIAPESWVLKNPKRQSDGMPAILAPLIGLIESGSVTVTTDQVFSPGEVIAGMPPSDLRGLGLPAPMPYTLEVQGRGLVTDPNFRFGYRFIYPNGRPVMGAERSGPLINAGAFSHVISEPFFSLVSAIDRFNSSPPAQIADRMDCLASIQELIPDVIHVGDYFKNIRIVRADGFSLRAFTNRNGQADFDPVLLRSKTKTDLVDDEASIESQVLPVAAEKAWTERFRRLAKPARASAAEAGWYVVVPEPVRAALEVVRKFQQGSETERRSFLRNPRTYLHDALGENLSEQALESLFWETDEYSRRVREIGIWKPKVLPFIRPAAQAWLPPDESGICVDNIPLAVPPEQIDSVIDEVRKAMAQGKAEIEYSGSSLPASGDTIAALEQLKLQVRVKGEKGEEKQPSERVALLILDNLDVLEFSQDVRPGKGMLGTTPSSLMSKFLPHQVEGYRWLQELWISGSRGGLLADDMGLGKTIQALAFLAWVQEQTPGTDDKRPILVVGPTGLLRNWKAEHDKHLQSPGLGQLLEAHSSGIRMLRLSGAARGGEVAGGLPVLDVERLRGADWVLTTYETLRDYQHSFGRVHWLVAVFDEAQKIKNPATLMTDAAKAVNADVVLALTGTPVENRLSDLWSIVDAVRPGFLGSLKDFIRIYEPTGGGIPEATTELKELLTSRRSPAVLLRRMKEDHLQGLPPIEYHSIERLMPAQQARAYEGAVHEAKTQGGAAKMLEALQHLRRISLHPSPRGDEDDDAYISFSARMQVAFEIMDKIYERKEKALIFLESLAVQGILSELMQRRYNLEFSPQIISGEVAGPKRMERVEEFQERSGFGVMILSPRAGGVGLTLTAANHVIHIARWWNPAVEDQCTDRVYRIGQKNPVHVYLPIAIHPDYGDFSFDKRLDVLLQKKRSLSRTVLAPTAASAEDMQNLYSEVVQFGNTPVC